ncbi:MAG: hypothetical protein Fur0032_20980 [Terrimicrobiaceae bacterium]
MNVTRGMLDTLSQLSVDYLLGKAELRQTGVSILARYKGDTEDTVNSALASLGIYVFVWPVRGLKVLSNTPGIYWSDWEWYAELGEDPTINQTGYSAGWFAEQIALHMLGWDPGVYGVNPLYAPDDVITDAEDPDFNGYFIRLRSSGGIPAKP